MLIIQLIGGILLQVGASLAIVKLAPSSLLAVRISYYWVHIIIYTLLGHTIALTYFGLKSMLRVIETGDVYFWWLVGLGISGIIVLFLFILLKNNEIFGYFY